MAVTVIEITNVGSSHGKYFIMEHTESLLEIRDKIEHALARAYVKRYGTTSPRLEVCFDDLWADIQQEFNELGVCRHQWLDIGQLLLLPKVTGLIFQEGLLGPKNKD